VAAVDQDVRAGAVASERLQPDLARLLDVANALLVAFAIAPVACEA